MGSLTPIGKGIFNVRTRSLFNGDTAQMVLAAKALSLDWISFKVADGTTSYFYAQVQAAVRAFQSAGIRCWGWHFVYGRDIGSGADISPAEALMSANMVNQLGLEGIMIDAENQYENAAGNKDLATKYINLLKSRIDPSAGIGLCSFRFPSVHGGFPFAEFLAGCSFHIPQVYWEGRSGDNDSAFQLGQSYKELQAIKALPFAPLGVACMDNGWKPTPAQIASFNEMALNLKLPAIGWYVWEGMLAYPELAEAVRVANGWSGVVNPTPIPAPINPLPPVTVPGITITDAVATKFAQIQDQMVADLRKYGDIGTYTSPTSPVPPT